MSSPSFELTEMVRAGAGAGKTTQLTCRVIQVADDYHRAHKAWPRLVVTTFTRKATQELRERLITKACELERGDLLDYISSSGQLYISTLHGMFSYFLRSYAHLLDWEGAFTLMEEQEAYLLAEKVLHQIIFSKKQADFFSLIEAYGFKGTTKLLLRLWKFDMEFSDLKTCTSFDFQKAISLKAQKQAKRLACVLEKMNDFHSPSWRNYKDICNRIGKFLTQGQVSQAREILQTLPRKPTRPKEACKQTDSQFKTTVDEVKKWLNDASNDSTSWITFTQLSGELERLFKIFKNNYASLKKESGVFEISDLELLTHQTISQEPQLAERFSQEWDYWLIDEYQDTSPLQIEILKSLIGDKPSFIVGDPQQSIYLFRGARSEIFDIQQKKTLNQGGKLTFLDTNYRSCPELLYFFNDFFSHLSPHFKPMNPQKGPVDPSQVVATYSITKPAEESPTLPEDKAICHHIQLLLERGEKYEDICVLARTNSHLNEMANFLDSHNLPTHVHTSGGFHERREVLDALSLLKFILNPHDNLNLITLLRSPWFHLEDQVIVDTLSQYKEENNSLPLSYWHALLKESGKLQNLQALLKKVSQVGVSEAWKGALIECGIFDFTRKHDPSGRRESNLWKLLTQLDQAERQPGFNYLHFINSLLKGEWAEGGDAVACLEPHRINLMTIHASKGLTFEHVILPRMNRRPLLTESASQKPLLYLDEKVKKWTLAVPLGEEKKMHHSPVARDIFEQLSTREKKESDRLLYVALTRAKKSVFLSWSQKTPQHIENNSWVEKIKIPSGEGIFSQENYSIKVQRHSCEKLSLPQALPSLTPPPIRKPWAVGSPRKVDRISVSQVLENKTKPLSLKTLQGLSQGILMHRVMESLRYKGNMYESWIKRESTPQLQKAVEFVQNLTLPPMAKLLETGWAEWGFQMHSGEGHLLEGRIDLWGTVTTTNGKKETWVIDYKSGARHIEKAFKQLNFYAQALKKYNVEGEIKLAVVYPFRQRVEVR